MEDRQAPIHTRELRQSFNDFADLYEQGRPGYPDVVFDELARVSGLQAGGEVLEIGIGTGKATLSLAARGFLVHGIELGDDLASIARSRLSAYPNVSVTVSDFDTWQTSQTYDAVFSASAFHWLDPKWAFLKARKCMKNSATLILLTSVPTTTESNRWQFEAISGALQREVPDLGVRLPRDESSLRQLCSERAGDISSLWWSIEWGPEAAPPSGAPFEPPSVLLFPSAPVLNADQYLALLHSYGVLHGLELDLAERAAHAVQSVIERDLGGKVTRNQISILAIARAL